MIRDGLIPVIASKGGPILRYSQVQAWPVRVLLLLAPCAALPEEYDIILSHQSPLGLRL